MAEVSAVQASLWTLKEQYKLAQDILLNNSDHSGKIPLAKKYAALLSMLKLLTDPDKVSHMESVLIEHKLMDEVDRRCTIEFVPMNKYLEERQLRIQYYQDMQNLLAQNAELQEKLLRALGNKRVPGDEKW